MAETPVVKSVNASPDASTGMVATQVSQKVLGEDVALPMTPLEMRSDGKLWKASAAAADSHAVVFGWSTRGNGKAGQTMTVYREGVVGKYADETLVPGAILYLGETAGTLSSIATTGDKAGVAQAIDASNIVTRQGSAIAGSGGVATAVAGVAAGYKIARGKQALGGSNPTTVVTGLATVVAFVCSLDYAVAPGDNTSVITSHDNATPGSVDVYAWKNTGGTDPTLVASTGTETFNWVAIGT